MSTSINAVSLSASINSISVPSSASFIGSSDDAVLLQMIVLISSSDRFRETIRADISGAERIIRAIEALSSRLNQFGGLLKSSWTAVTYASLAASAKDATTLRALFAADGPNLGNSLAASTAALAELAGDSVVLTAPKETPLMVENFIAVKGKVDLSGAPSSATIDWKSDQDLEAINTGTSAGSYPGTVVKTVETRDSKNNLVSVARYTIFVDYANLRPTQSDMQLAYGSLQQRITPLLAELESALAQVRVKKDFLDDRIRNEMSKVTDDYKTIESMEKDQSDALLDAVRLLRLFRADLDKRLDRMDKEMKNDSGSGIEADAKSNPPPRSGVNGTAAT